MPRCFTMDIELSPCCASCYLSYYSKFLTEEEQRVMLTVSKDCFCEHEDAAPAVPSSMAMSSTSVPASSSPHYQAAAEDSVVLL